ncbi:hypothetical protein LSH36_743g00021 [Paralvinella palmiformis]|uniref:Uncharacterized protein n=1 Tax=Paralvinella palmiformis TaxID=53620 RepID=A0AAD9J122_9ANNE|nr:hypothetical protein LSH36_743g00021 [Paralvinella palmiformis]
MDSTDHIMGFTTETSTDDVIASTGCHIGNQGNKSHYDQDYVISRYISKLAMVVRSTNGLLFRVSSATR